MAASNLGHARDDACAGARIATGRIHCRRGDAARRRGGRWSIHDWGERHCRVRRSEFRWRLPDAEWQSELAPRDRAWRLRPMLTPHHSTPASHAAMTWCAISLRAIKRAQVCDLPNALWRGSSDPPGCSAPRGMRLEALTAWPPLRMQVRCSRRCASIANPVGVITALHGVY